MGAKRVATNAGLLEASWATRNLTVLDDPSQPIGASDSAALNDSIGQVDLPPSNVPTILPEVQGFKLT